MSLKIGIVGLPNVGKSTLFNMLTKKSVPAENYPFCTIDPSVGIVPVPDARLTKLNEFSRSAKMIPAAIEFVDIAGLVAGAAEGAGLGNKFLSHIRETDAIVHLVRTFSDSNVVHVDGDVLPKRDVDTINSELRLADLASVHKHLQTIDRDVKRGDKEARLEAAELEAARARLEAGESALPVRSLSLLSAKPMLYVFNGPAIPEIVPAGGLHVSIEAKTGQGLDDLIHQSYTLLGLITFFTTGPKESRAWTIKRGQSAKEAGAAIHSDFRDKFIRAAVVPWDKLIECGSLVIARERGLVRTEGKEYIVQDGDVVEFKI